MFTKKQVQLLVRDKNIQNNFFYRAVYFEWAAQLVLYGGDEVSEVQCFIPYVSDKDAAEAILAQIAPGVLLATVNDR